MMNDANMKSIIWRVIKAIFLSLFSVILLIPDYNTLYNNYLFVILLATVLFGLFYELGCLHNCETNCFIKISSVFCSIFACLFLFFRWHSKITIFRIANILNIDRNVLLLLIIILLFPFATYVFKSMVAVIFKLKRGFCCKTVCLAYIVLIFISGGMNPGFFRPYYESIAALSVWKNGFGNKTQLDLIDMDKGSYFDPFILNKNGDLSLYASDRRNGSICKFIGKESNNFGAKKTVLAPSTTEWQQVINRATICDDKMYFTGQNNGKSYIGIAVKNENGYQSVFDEPILSPTEDYEGVSVMNPFVLHYNNLYYMYYAAGEQYEPDVICLAVSEDGINFTKRGVVLEKRSGIYLDCCKVGAVDIKIKDGCFVMYYIGYTHVSTARILYATSKDGINWERTFLNCLVAPSKEFDISACYKPAVYEDDNTGKTFIYYNGREYDHETICVVSK